MYSQRSTHILNLIVGLLIVSVLAIVVFIIQSIIFERLERASRENYGLDNNATSTGSSLEPGDNNVIPPFTDEVHQQLESSQGFQYLISYTDRGFEPEILNVRAGETIRFTNNASVELRLLSIENESSVPPSTDCDNSLEGCHLLNRGEFWEITLNDPGKLFYINGTERGGAGLLTITVQ